MRRRLYAGERGATRAAPDFIDGFHAGYLRRRAAVTATSMALRAREALPGAPPRHSLGVRAFWNSSPVWDSIQSGVSYWNFGCFTSGRIAWSDGRSSKRRRPSRQSTRRRRAPATTSPNFGPTTARSQSSGRSAVTLAPGRPPIRAGTHHERCRCCDGEGRVGGAPGSADRRVPPPRPRPTRARAHFLQRLR